MKTIINTNGQIQSFSGHKIYIEHSWKYLNPTIKDTTVNTYDVWIEPKALESYPKGKIILHNQQLWISIIEDNVWEPGVYGWEVIN